ncbi:MAG: hypothetical protein V3573_12180 [Desulfovibrionaceae bacterium]
MTRFFSILALLAGLALAAFLVVNNLTTGMTESADSFFQSVREGRFETAYNYLSKGFRQTVSPEELQAFLRRGALDRYQTSAWTSRNYSGDTGELEGTIYSVEGAVTPLSLTFVREEGEWRIHFIDARLPGLARKEITKDLPDQETLEIMVRDTVSQFSHAVVSADFAEFHTQISALWASQISPDELLAVFRAFIDMGKDLTGYDQLDPVFSEPPAIDQDGVMVLKGYIPHERGLLHFRLEYVFEYPEWKLLGINIRT